MDIGGDEIARQIAAAASPDWRVRAKAGRRLAAAADRPEVAAALHTLLLDADDTAVTDAVGHALLERGDAHGDRLLAQAFAVADPEQQDHLSWILAERDAAPPHPS